uniref:NAD-dependent epimerase/dehydratase family protein n=1 Tax=Erysipelothrix rhusiopathiae TaxID=1648 RepID=A0A6S6I666_ERYRH|nr:NAD-dependent epimerase/dehydratase family protein [Erysipelothrix rhusiopathiae]
MRVLVTGVAGFIGSSVAKRLLNDGIDVIGIDNLNDYYDVNLKHDRLKDLENDKFTFLRGDISDKDFVYDVYRDYIPNYVVHLAAQAGVRYSLENPDAYIQSNVIGTYNILEACRHYPVTRLLYASSSSVYGSNTKVPFEETDRVDNPVSLYAATKKSNELMAQTYSHLYDIDAIGLRFFTVYGPKGRPDMAYFGFVDKYFNNESIQIFNDGDFTKDLYRDFTYIDDIVEGIINLLYCENSSGHEVYNIGNNTPVKLMDFITILENSLSKSMNYNIEFDKKYEPIKPGDVPATYASTDKLFNVTGYKPKTILSEGLQKFTDWYVLYYGKAKKL